jgi:hypothetical protein
MSKTPERDVLKETIAKLKAKNIASYNFYLATVKVFQDSIESLVKQLQEASSQLETRDQQKIDAVIMLLSVMEKDGTHLVTSSLNAINDLKLYVDILENYSTELDSTLADIFEKAKKYAKEKTKEQKELMN